MAGGRKHGRRWKHQQSVRYRAGATAVTVVEITDVRKAQLKRNRTKGGGRGDRDKEVIKGLEIRNWPTWLWGRESCQALRALREVTTAAVRG